MIVIRGDDVKEVERGELLHQILRHKTDRTFLPGSGNRQKTLCLLSEIGPICLLLKKMFRFYLFSCLLLLTVTPSELLISSTVVHDANKRTVINTTQKNFISTSIKLVINL